MVTSGRGRSEESNGQVTVGCRVAVLNGRHFPAFGAGDEGVVTKLTPESQNCEVQFDSSPKPVPVALRHLKVIAPVGRDSPQKGKVGRDSPQKGKLENADTNNGYSHPLDTECPNCGNIYMADANFCRHCGQKRVGFQQEDTECREQWSGLTSLLNAEAPSMEHCEYMDSAEGFAAGLAAVSGVAANGVSNFNAQRQDMHPSVIDQAGFPKHAHFAPELAHANPEAECATVTVPLYSPRGTQYTPRAVINPASGPAGRQSPHVAGAHCSQVADDLSCSCAEVASLRHALTQCVGSMGTCAKAIESMCSLQGGMHMQHPESLVGWKSAAMALRDAADLGAKALQTPSSNPHGMPAAISQHGADTPRHPVQSGSIQRISSTTSLTSMTPVPVEVLGPGAGMPSAPGPSSCMDTQRRFLVASPVRHSQPPSLHPASMGGLPFLQSLPQIQTQPLSGGVGLAGLGAAPSALGQHSTPNMLASPGGQHPMPSVLGSPLQLQPPAGLHIQGFSPLRAVSPMPGVAPLPGTGAVAPPGAVAPLPGAGVIAPLPGAGGIAQLPGASAVAPPPGALTPGRPSSSSFDNVNGH